MMGFINRSKHIALMAMLILYSFWLLYPQVSFADEASQAFDRINQIRQQAGLQPLTYSPILTEVSKTIAKQVVAQQKSGRKEDIKLKQLLTKARYSAGRTAVAVEASNLSPEAQIDNWLKNPDNVKNFLDADMLDIGISATRGLITDQKGEGAVWTAILSIPLKPSADGWRLGVQKYVNEFRASFNLPPLTLNDNLNLAAQDYSKRMALNDFVAHKSPSGDQVGERAHKAGYSWQLIYENLHAGKGSAREAVDAWIASKTGHREAMLNQDITEMGIGYYFLPLDEGKAPFTHYWTLVMAKPAS